MGYRFIYELNFGTTQSSYVYAKDTATNYSYEFPLFKEYDIEGFIAQLTDEGVRGFKYGGPYDPSRLASDFVAIYRKQEDSGKYYSYDIVNSKADTSVDVVASLNSRGINGYRYIDARAFFVSRVQLRVYEKTSSSPAVYAYEAVPLATSDIEFLAQLNSEGAKGFRFRNLSTATQAGIFSVYEKDLSQSSTFTYEALTPASSIDEFIDRANVKGQAGSIYAGPYVLPSGISKDLYVEPRNCAGDLCVTYGVYGF